jgi:phenylacetate-CoA ligase
MKLDLMKVRMSNRAFSDRPMVFVDPAPKKALADIIDLIAIETGSRVAREYWQQKQLQNLLRHAAERSLFWRKRHGSKKFGSSKLEELSSLSRRDVVEQVSTEGALLKASDGIEVESSSTSGSSGKAVKFFLSKMNISYNAARSVAQYFIENRDLSLNRTRLGYSTFAAVSPKTRVQKSACWLPSLSPPFLIGSNKTIHYTKVSKQELDEVISELAKDQVGCLVSGTWILEPLLQRVSALELRKMGTEICIPMGGALDPQAGQRLIDAGIAVRSNYSAEEVGMIAAECDLCPGFYHVATSNVIVECDNRDTIEVGGKHLSRILVTHLHSYATPFIRYDIGDYAILHDKCCCGFDGPTLSNVYGRSKTFLKCSDGSLVPFHPHALHLLAIADLDEFRIRQVAESQVIAEFVPKQTATSEQLDRLKARIGEGVGPGFEVTFEIVSQIDWGEDRKRLGFKNELL